MPIGASLGAHQAPFGCWFKGRADALYVVIDPLVSTNRIRINTLALGARLPTMHGFRKLVKATEKIEDDDDAALIEAMQKLKAE